MSRKITSVIGPEPMRTGEDPDFYSVGRNDVTKIDEWEQNLGSYAIIWFEVYTSKGLLAKMNAMHVAAVRYD
jgi:hypothetical protein